MDKVAQAVEKPNAFLTVQVKAPWDETHTGHELFMSAGLIRTLVSYVNANGEIAEVYTNPQLQSFLILEVLKRRSPKGQSTDDFTLDDFDLSVGESNKIIDWVVEHVVDFFQNAVEKMGAAAMTGGSLKRLMDSMSGFMDSLPKKPSAGPSTQE